MRCGKARTLINLELDGVLPPEQTPSLDEHLARCGDCRAHREELELGGRMIRATAEEPSDAFEWKLQLRLNRALQEAAGEGVPWDEPADRPWFGWLRSFGLSAAAGLAFVVVMTTWVLPDLGMGPAAPGGTLADAGSRPAVSDRLSLQPETRIFDFKGSRGGAGPATVGTGAFLGSEPEWLSDAPDSRRTISVLEEEVRRLRTQLVELRTENEHLKALLVDGGMEYLDLEDSTRNE